MKGKHTGPILQTLYNGNTALDAQNLQLIQAHIVMYHINLAENAGKNTGWVTSVQWEVQEAPYGLWKVLFW